MKKLQFVSFVFLCFFTAMSQKINSKDIEKIMRDNKIPAIGYGIIENAELTKIEVLGSLSNGKKAPHNTIFNVASVTKPMTAYVTLKLVSLGKWDLDAPLYNYFVDPDIKDHPYAKLITTRHILTHQTGFPNWRDGKLTFLFKPGEKWSYSGEGFEYLRKALQKKFNQTLDELAATYVFEPLKMTSTQYVYNKIDVNRFADGFNKDGEAYDTYQRTIANGADDLLTTIEDYGTFLTSILKEEGLSKSVFQDVMKDQVASTKGKFFTLGFEKYKFKDGNYALAHGGSDYGVQAYFFIFPKTKQGILIFTNSDVGYHVYQKLLTKYLGVYGQEFFEIETGQKVALEKEYTVADQKLYDEIIKQDAVFFEAYNTCDLKIQEEIYADDVEFFHDKAGFMDSKKEIIASTQKYICNKVRRELVKEGLEIYPIKNYGAVEIGYHKFYNKSNPNDVAEPMKFMIVWRHQGNRWKIEKVISLH